MRQAGGGGAKGFEGRSLGPPPRDKMILNKESARINRAQGALHLGPGNNYYQEVRQEGMTMASSVNLGEQLEAFITEAVKNGRYGSRSEVLREGVRLVQEREAKWARFDAEIQKGIDDLDAGRSEDLEVVIERLQRKYRAMARKPAA